MIVSSILVSMYVIRVHVFVIVVSRGGNFENCVVHATPFFLSNPPPPHLPLLCVQGREEGEVLNFDIITRLL